MDRCYGCLSSKNERRLEVYIIKKLIFRSILQMDRLLLCYICRRVAVQTEKFIHNVETAADLFADTKQNTQSTCDNYKTILHPLLNLSCKILQSCDDIVLNSCQSDDIGIKHEFQEVSFPYAEVVEIKKEEQTQDYTHNNAPDLTEILKTADFSCINDAIQSDSNIIDDVRDNDDDDFKYTSDNKKKITEKEFCAGVITLSREEVDAERQRRSTEPKYLEAGFKCAQCIKGFVMRTPYENHMKLHDKTRGDNECDICKQRLKTKSQLENHYRYHIERYRCSACEETRNCYMSLKDHYLRKHSDGRCEYACPVCFKQFRFRSSLQKHKSDKHEQRERMKCKYCDKTFASESAIGYHLKFNHTQEESANLKRHKCDVCGRSFKMLQKLKTHMVTHSNVRSHYCVECDKSFKTRTALNLHFRTVVAHNQTDRQQYLFNCPQCDKRFPHKKALARHTSGVHNNQTLQCNQCGKTFKNKKNLSVHILSHEGYEPPKNHSCSVCNKRFHEKGVLAKHMNTHTGERPFTCAQCPARFAHSGSLYNHVRLVHLHLTRRGTPKDERGSNRRRNIT
ncbi:hypothetical protein O0L34_g11925 [Tuta absoluta]|nr:hypothetical protein O0L34_g11925 [Tuta absoluta]